MVPAVLPQRLIGACEVGALEDNAGVIRCDGGASWAQGV